jgi:hypothetical protein
MITPLLTYRDAYEHLLDVYNQVGRAVGAQDRRIRRAVIEAYRLLPSMHDWAYFRKTATIETTLPETHASAVYTTADNLVTISTGTWNADARFGAVVIGNVRYSVKRRVSDTVIELDSGPDDDVTESIRWQRFRYLLPADVGDIISVIDPRQYFDIRRVPPVETYWWNEVVNAETYPLVWSLIASTDFPGRWELWLSGSGQTQRTLSYYYLMRHTNLVVDELSTGTVSVDGDTATFSTSVLEDKHVGCVLRVSSDATAPTSQYGKYNKDAVTGVESNILNPAETEAIITEKTSGTVAVLSETGIASVSGRGYTISSHINVNYEGMWEFFLRLCEEQYDIITRADTAIRNVSRATRLEAMRAAMIADGALVSRRTTKRWRGDVILEDEG